MSPRQLFVVPDLGGHPSGGTVFNARLIDALRAAGQAPALNHQPSRARDDIRSADLVWVDSLFLDAVPALQRELRATQRLGLVLHYLPSLVSVTKPLSRRELSEIESAALASADIVLATSDFMLRVVRELGFGDRRLLCLPPGSDVSLVASLPPAELGVRAALVAHVIESKGVDALLTGLEGALLEHDPFTLQVIGDLDVAPEYARRCREHVSRSRVLRDRVTFRGVIEPSRVARELANSNVLLSASVMESFGMALSDARRAGLPILAVDAGNVKAHVNSEAGGELCADAPALARACVRLCRDPALHARRLAAARDHAPEPRPWSAVANELLTACYETIPE